jgi:hypothetical protein
MNRQGFAPLILILVIAVLMAVAGIWYYEAHKPASPQVLPIPSATTTASVQTISSSTASTTAVSASPTSSLDALGSFNGQSLAYGTTTSPLAPNRSSLHLDSADKLILLADPEGLETGYDASSSNVLQQIPNSAFSSEAIQDVENPTYVVPPADYFIDVHQPMDGAYKLVLIGGQDGGIYDVTMATFARDGSRQSYAELTGNIASGTNKTFQINFVSSPNSSSTMH